MAINFRSQLEFYISQHKFTRQYVGTQCGVSHTCVSNWLAGKKPSIEACERLDRLFHTQTGFWRALAEADYGTLQTERGSSGASKAIPKVRELMAQGLNAMQISNNLNIPTALAQSYIKRVRDDAVAKHKAITGQTSTVPMSMIPTIIPPPVVPVEVSDVQQSYSYEVQLSICSAQVDNGDSVRLVSGGEEYAIEGTIQYDSIPKLIECLKWLKSHEGKSPKGVSR